MNIQLGKYVRSLGFTLVQLVIAIVVAAIVITVVLVVVLQSGTAANAVVPPPACNTTLTLSGASANATETSRFGPHRDWVAARSAMNTRVRTAAEADALTNLNSEFASYACPDECPSLNRTNQVRYNTTSSITGSNGWGWIRYDAQASSQASENFKCE